jgi:thioesterase domain-containing protein
MADYLSLAAQKYQAKAFPGRLHIFRASKAPRGFFVEEFWDWEAFASGGVELAFVDGDHFSIFRPPGVHQMAKKIAEAQVQAARGASAKIMG